MSGFCYWCRRSFNKRDPTLARTRDHLVSKSHGGNCIVPCCRACNELKGDMTVWQWQEVMSKVPRWWTLLRTQRWRGKRLYVQITMKG